MMMDMIAILVSVKIYMTHMTSLLQDARTICSVNVLLNSPFWKIILIDMINNWVDG